jgi:hypothetical protein
MEWRVGRTVRWSVIWKMFSPPKELPQEMEENGGMTRLMMNLRKGQRCAGPFRLFIFWQNLL